MATENQELHEKVLDEALSVVRDYRAYSTAPEVGRAMHMVVKKITGNQDPYQKWKTDCINAANQAYPLLEAFIKGREDQVYWALKAGAVGNVMDAAVYSEIDLESLIAGELEKAFPINHSRKLTQTLQSASTILLIGDNAGETVFDRFLLEQFRKIRNHQVFYAVRSEPIINDATVDEAVASGLESVATIIDTGCSAPGLIIDECNKEFLQIYHQADLVISKGQGNYETLSAAEREIYFLLKAKCPVIAERLGVEVNEYVVLRHCPGS